MFCSNLIIALNTVFHFKTNKKISKIIIYEFYNMYYKIIINISNILFLISVFKIYEQNKTILRLL